MYGFVEPPSQLIGMKNKKSKKNNGLKWTYSIETSCTVHLAHDWHMASFVLPAGFFF
jgi:hypothetical protein